MCNEEQITETVMDGMIATGRRFLSNRQLAEGMLATGGGLLAALDGRATAAKLLRDLADKLERAES